MAADHLAVQASVADAEAVLEGLVLRQTGLAGQFGTMNLDRLRVFIE